jgi:hypothetical protein
MKKDDVTTHQGIGEDWVAVAREYCSRIERGPGSEVRLFRRDETDACLALKRDTSRTLAVFDDSASRIGVIQAAGSFIRPKHAMHVDSRIAWTLAPVSLLHHRHTLQLDGGVAWQIRTPFFSTGCRAGSADGATVIGHVRRTDTWLWLVEPGRDFTVFLAALGLVHRKWYRR